MIDQNQRKLLTEFAKQSDKLFDSGVIRTDSFTGEIGEYVASVLYGLKKTNRVTKGVDGVDKKGKKYQVKAKIVESDKLNFSLGNIDTQGFDYLVIVYFDPTFEPKKVIKINSNQLTKGKVSISHKFLQSIEYKSLEGSEIKIPEKKRKEIEKFGQIYQSLQEENIIRSKKVVGDLGEFYACQYLNLTLNQNKNEKGVDAFDKKGAKYEIKTRRVYESGRRTSKSRRLNNLAGKDSKYLVVVALDRGFRCAGMWLMPMKNVKNPKSAHLQVVNYTPGVKKIVKSKIDWLL